MQISSYNEIISSAGICGFRNHLWYNHEETIGGSLFVDQVPNIDKKCIAKSLFIKGDEGINSQCLASKAYW